MLPRLPQTQHAAENNKAWTLDLPAFTAQVLGLQLRHTCTQVHPGWTEYVEMAYVSKSSHGPVIPKDTKNFGRAKISLLSHFGYRGASQSSRNESKTLVKFATQKLSSVWDTERTFNCSILWARQQAISKKHKSHEKNKTEERSQQIRPCQCQSTSTVCKHLGQELDECSYNPLIVSHLFLFIK